MATDSDSSGTRKSASKSASKTTKKSAGKSTAEKSPAKKSTAKKSTGSSDGRSRSAPRAASRPAATATQVAAQAARELLELTGKAAEGITGLERSDDGWTVQVEVVEVRRIPDTTDVLALYEIQTDDRGSLQGYRRVRRYARGVPGED